MFAVSFGARTRNVDIFDFFFESLLGAHAHETNEQFEIIALCLACVREKIKFSKILHHECCGQATCIQKAIIYVNMYTYIHVYVYSQTKGAQSLGGGLGL